MNILILDGVNKNTLAIVRHLGRLKVGQLDVVSYQKASIAFFSKFVSSRIILPNPNKEGDKFVNSLLLLLGSKHYDLVIPVGYRSFQLCSKHQLAIKKVTCLIIPTFESMEIAASKIQTQQIAKKIGLFVPKTLVIKNISEIEREPITFPAVIKAPVELGKSIVNYAFDRAELIEKFKQMCTQYDSENQLPIIQEYIEGEGVGFFAFYIEGECKRIFMHRRIREYPASGGASVCAEGFYDEKLLDHGKRLLDHLKWNGVAMVEFKKNNKTGEYVLMEINPKFWGSLDLSLVSGVVFPNFMVQIAKGQDVCADFSYKRDVRFQWLLNGELYRIFERPGSLFKIIGDLFRSKNDIWVSDPFPNMFQLFMVPVDLFKKWFR